MNEDESKIYAALYDLVKEYEKTSEIDSRTEIFSRMNSVAAEQIDLNFLNDYWRSMSIEEFCEIHSIIPEKCENRSKDEIEAMLSKLLSCENGTDDLNYYIRKYEKAVEFCFKKNSGALADCFYEENINSVTELIEVLSKPDVIQL